MLKNHLSRSRIPCWNLSPAERGRVGERGLIVPNHKPTLDTLEVLSSVSPCKSKGVGHGDDDACI